MKTNISLPKDDRCILCENVCPENVYDCPELQHAIETKGAVYKWCWEKNEKTPKKSKEKP